jgi:hypothetical protein
MSATVHNFILRSPIQNLKDWNHTPSALAQATPLLTGIREVSDSNVGPDTDHSEFLPGSLQYLQPKAGLIL